MFTANVILDVIKKQHFGLAKLIINGRTYIDDTYSDKSQLKSDILYALTQSYYDYTLSHSNQKAGENIEKLNIVEENIEKSLINNNIGIDMFTKCVKGILESELPMEVVING